MMRRASRAPVQGEDESIAPLAAALLRRTPAPDRARRYPQASLRTGFHDSQTSILEEVSVSILHLPRTRGLRDRPHLTQGSGARDHGPGLSEVGRDLPLHLAPIPRQIDAVAPNLATTFLGVKQFLVARLARDQLPHPVVDPAEAPGVLLLCRHAIQQEQLHVAFEAALPEEPSEINNGLLLIVRAPQRRPARLLETFCAED
mmetsp:Transcript_105295/g.302767  ORF Transcript_105295/g.302767 Transcript_105295/m.302767 type:complete len:202 (-) Transcript_105295:832-1437(-)